MWYPWFNPGRRWDGFFYFMAWKTFENDRFLQTKPAPFREEATIFTIAEKAKINSSFTLSVQCRIVSQARRNPPFLYQNRGQKNAPYIGAHASIQTVAARWYPNVSSAAIGLSLPGCAAAGVHVYGKQRTFSVLRICTNNSGFLASCGPAAEKISGDVNPAHFFGSLFSPVRIMFGL